MKLEHLPEVVKTKRVVTQDETFTITLNRNEANGMLAIMENTCGESWQYDLYHALKNSLGYTDVRQNPLKLKNAHDILINIVPRV